MKNPPLVILSALLLATMMLPTSFAQMIGPEAPKKNEARKEENKEGELDILKGRPDRPGAEQSKRVFRSGADGLRFLPPENMQQRDTPNDIALYIDLKKRWSLRVNEVTTRGSMKLDQWRDNVGRPVAGMLQSQVKQLANHADTQLLRAEVIDINKSDVGMIAMRYTDNLKRWLLQQAIYQRSDTRFVTVTMVSLAAEQPDPKNPDAGEVEAVKAFRKTLESLRLLDQAKVRADQEKRLHNTRWLFLVITEDRIRQAIDDNYWLLVKTKGKPTGYIRVAERAAGRNQAPGVEIVSKARIYRSKDDYTTTTSTLYMNYERTREHWGNFAVTLSKEKNGNENKLFVSETGSSYKNLRGQTSLEVRYDSNRIQIDPVHRPHLPPWYVPQAFGHLLPRIMPLDKPRDYLLASYIAARREAMGRYVEVEAEKTVEFDGRQVKAHVINDRIGLEGDITRHYVTKKGEYLGSEVLETGVVVVRTDIETLQKLFAHVLEDAKEEPQNHQLTPGKGGLTPLNPSSR